MRMTYRGAFVGDLAKTSPLDRLRRPERVAQHLHLARVQKLEPRVSTSAAGTLEPLCSLLLYHLDVDSLLFRTTTLTALMLFMQSALYPEEACHFASQNHHNAGFPRGRRNYATKSMRRMPAAEGISDKIDALFSAQQ